MKSHAQASHEFAFGIQKRQKFFDRLSAGSITLSKPMLKTIERAQIVGRPVFVKTEWPFLQRMSDEKHGPRGLLTGSGKVAGRSRVEAMSFSRLKMVDRMFRIISVCFGSGSCSSICDSRVRARRVARATCWPMLPDFGSKRLLMARSRTARRLSMVDSEVEGAMRGT